MVILVIICTNILFVSAGPFRPRTATEHATAMMVNNKRSNGALLSIATNRKASIKNDKFAITWEIDYNGPRKPFTVLEPSLTVPMGDSTQLIIYCDGKDNEVETAHLTAPDSPEIFHPSKYCYQASRDGKPVTGQLQITLSAISAKIGKRRGWALRANETIYLHLHFKTTHRGQLAEPPLDAWTGELYSQPTAITIQP